MAGDGVRALGRFLPEPVATAVRRHRRAAALRELAGGDDPEPDGDGVPVPGPRLRVLVAGTEDREAFLRTGAAHAARVEALVAEHDVALGPGRVLLDAGCGCGRIARHLLGTGADVRGIDINPELVAWTRERLGIPAGTVGINPPAPGADGEIDVVLAYSVLTHLTGPQQRSWLGEWARLLRPGGLVVCTTHGRSRLVDLEPGPAAAFAAGELVVLHPSAAGDNLCRAYLPPAFGPRLFAPLEVLAHLPAREDESGRYEQDWWVLRRP